MVIFCNPTGKFVFRSHLPFSTGMFFIRVAKLCTFLIDISQLQYEVRQFLVVLYFILTALAKWTVDSGVLCKFGKIPALGKNREVNFTSLVFKPKLAGRRNN